VLYSYPGYPVSMQLWLISLSIVVKPTGLSFSVKKQTPLQESANQISVAIKYLSFFLGMKRKVIFWYQHKDSLGLVNCNSNLPAVEQDDVCDTVQHPEKINTDYQ